LPAIITNAAGGKAHFGNRAQNYLLIDQVQGLNAPYVVAFTVVKSNQTGVAATMFVVSAHERPNLQPGPRIRLSMLVMLTVEGRPIVRPKK